MPSRTAGHSKAFIYPVMDHLRESQSALVRGRFKPLYILKVICPEFQVIRGFSQKILADLLSYDQIHS